MGTKAGIRGAQVKDDSLTGDDIAESTLILPQAYHSSGNHNNLSVVYLALPGRNGWSTSFTKSNMQLIAPYDGMVTKVFLRPTTGDNSTACIFQVRTCGDGQTCEGDGAAITVTNNEITVGVNRGTTEAVFPEYDPDDNSGQAPILKGDAFCFAILKMSSPSYGVTDAVIVIEWDLSS